MINAIRKAIAAARAGFLCTFLVANTPRSPRNLAALAVSS